MRQVVPEPLDDIDPYTVYAADDRPTPPDRPWVLVNMVTSVDGATAVAGRSGGLAGPADREAFRAIRAVADVILVGAGTVRAEQYGPVQLPEPIQARRLQRGQAALPRLAIVSGALDLGLGDPMFTDSDPPPIVITSPGADRVRRTEVADVGADLVLAGNGPRVDLHRGLAVLGELGASVVLCEGGPTLNGALFAAGLVDELCLTLSPLLVGGASSRAIAGDEPAQATPLTLRRILVGDGALLLRYVRA